MKLLAVVVIVFMVWASGTGCMSAYRNASHDTMASDTLAAPPMTINDVITLSKQGVSDSVIIHQMEATQSRFRLTTGGIIELKNAGVSETVIDEMVERSGAIHHAYSAYPYYGYYPYPYYGYYGYTGYPYFDLGFFYGFGRPFHGHFFPHGVRFHPSYGMRGFGGRR